MNKEHFLTLLKIKLKPLTVPQQEVILKDYEERFDKLLADGMGEPHASKQLGNPADIAKAILEEWGISPDNPSGETGDWEEISEDEQSLYSHSQSTPQTTSPFIHFWQITGILLFNLLFMIWIIFAGLAVIFSAWIAVIICLLAPILGLIALVLTGGLAGLFQLFISIGLCGLGFIGLSLGIPITIYVIRFIYQYTIWTFNVLRGEH